MPRCFICDARYRSANALPCGHRVHTSCRRKWLARHDSCPLCRTPVPRHLPPLLEGPSAFDDDVFDPTFFTRVDQWVQDRRMRAIAANVQAEQTEWERTHGIGLPLAMAFVQQQLANVQPDNRETDARRPRGRDEGRMNAFLEQQLAARFGAALAERFTIHDVPTWPEAPPLPPLVGPRYSDMTRADDFDVD